MSEHTHSSTPVSHRSFSDFVPLIVIAGVVVLLTAVTYISLAAPSIIDALRLFMGYFFLIFGGFKAVRLEGFVSAYRMYDIVAKRSAAYAYVYPFIELALAVLYLSGVFLLQANIITLVIMLIGAAGVYVKLREKEEIPCACLGAVFKIPMTYVTLIEDLLMAAMAAAMLLIGV